MSHNPHCTPTLHAALTADRAAFDRHPYLGFALDGGDVVEIHQCTQCGDELRRPLGIDVRLAQARTAGGGLGDQSMIGCCKRALNPVDGRIDEGAVRTYLDAVEFERLMRGRL